MSKTTDQHRQSVLDDETLELLGMAPAPVDLPPDRMQALRARVMERISQEKASELPPFVTIRAGEGEWIEIAPKIEKKCLHIDHAAGTESYLLRVQPGAEAPGHLHEQDELCLVLEGEVTFDDLPLRAGDWHFARKGSRHGTARTQTGALLYLQAPLEAHA